MPQDWVTEITHQSWFIPISGAFKRASDRAYPVRCCGDPAVLERRARHQEY